MFKWINPRPFLLLKVFGSSGGLGEGTGATVLGCMGIITRFEVVT